MIKNKVVVQAEEIKADRDVKNETKNEQRKITTIDDPEHPKVLAIKALME